MPTSQKRASKKRTGAVPWERAAPAKVARKRPTKLTSAQKAHAKTRANKAGRHYPNLVDNMREAAATKKKATKKKATKKKATKKSTHTTRSTRTPSRKATGSASASKRKSTTRRATKRTGATRKASPRRTPTKRTPTKRGARRTTAAKKETRDPHGGLTAAGRAEFARKDGAHLKPGVMKPASEMSTEEMRRKGSWAVRFYGRAGALPPLADAQGRPTRFALTAAAWGEPVPKTVRAARAIAAKGRKLLARAKRTRD